MQLVRFLVTHVCRVKQLVLLVSRLKTSEELYEKSRRRGVDHYREAGCVRACKLELKMGRLMQLVSAILCSACICGVMVAAAAAAAASSTSSGGLAAHYKLKTQRITLYAREVLKENSFRLLQGLAEASLPEAGLYFGTFFVFNYPLFPAYNFSDAATAQGTLRGTHTVVSYDGHDILFHHSYHLKDPLPVGTLTVSGVFSYSDPSIPVPIVGGTGAYSLLARGSLTLTPIEAGLVSDQTFQLDLDLHLLDEDLLLA